MKQEHEIKAFYEKTIKEVGQVFDQFPWEDPASYSNWLAQTYFFVRHSTRIIALAAAHFDMDKEEHHVRCLQHLREEQGHEKLLIQDLAALKMDVKHFDEFPETAMFYQSQSYFIQNETAMAFFGYLLCLEGLGAQKGPELYSRTRAAHGDKATMFLKVHSEADQEHIQQVFHHLKDLNSKEYSAIKRNFESSCMLYVGFLNRSNQKKSGPGKMAA